MHQKRMGTNLDAQNNFCKNSDPLSPGNVWCGKISASVSHKISKQTTNDHNTVQSGSETFTITNNGMLLTEITEAYNMVNINVC